MKKKYVKPEMFFEDFSLSTSIAAGCKEIVQKPIKYSADITIFVDAKMGCTEGLWSSTENSTIFDLFVQAQYNGACYHNPSETNDVFNS